MQTWCDVSFICELNDLLCVTVHEDGVSLHSPGSMHDNMEHRGFHVQFLPSHLGIVEEVAQGLRMLQDRRVLREMEEKVHAARAEYEEKVAPLRRQHELDVSAAYIEYQRFMRGEYVEAPVV